MAAPQPPRDSASSEVMHYNAYPLDQRKSLWLTVLLRRIQLARAAESSSQVDCSQMLLYPLVPLPFGPGAPSAVTEPRLH